jgi:hypothetical protein
MPWNVPSRESACASNRGNPPRTAEQLQIGLATLYRRFRDYGMIEGRRAGKGRGLAVRSS